MPSSKLRTRRSAVRHPPHCHVPPWPPILPLPPPVCPPDKIGGFIDAEWQVGATRQYYYSAYNAPKDPLFWFYGEDTGPTQPWHDLDIYLYHGAQDTLAIALTLKSADGYLAHYYKGAQPYAWCAHNRIYVSTWDTLPEPTAECTLMLYW